jgi:hypothetical protein
VALLFVFNPERREGNLSQPGTPGQTNVSHEIAIIHANSRPTFLPAACHSQQKTKGDHFSAIAMFKS